MRLGIAHVPDGRGTFVHLTHRGEPARSAPTRARDKAGGRAGLRAHLRLLPAPGERRRQQAGTLSGGEQQMLAIVARADAAAAAAAARRAVVRPGAADRAARSSRILRTHQPAASSVSMLLVEQNAALALDLADHAYLLETGRVVLSGQRRRHPAATTPCAASYLGVLRRWKRFLHQVFSGPRHRRHLRQPRAGAGDDLPGHAPRELRAGRDGDVLDLHRLGADQRRAAVLGRVRR